jgi:exopolysaccharide biosynthesis WecB/TagA/CpsF family protein
MREATAVQRDFRVDGISINVHSMPQAVSTIVTAAEKGHGFCVFTLNLDHCNKLRSDPKFSAAYKRARFVTADGFPIVLLGRLNRVPVRRTTGADLLEPLCGQASQRRMPVFLLGPSTAVISGASKELRHRVGELDIVGTYAPGPNFDPESPDADMAIERIRRSGARLCFVALGAPRQEIFAARCLERVPGVGFVCVGAALDFLAGTQIRAPRFFQNNGLEWLWRLSSNPQRLAARYLRCAAVLPRLVIGTIPQVLTARKGRVS